MNLENCCERRGPWEMSGKLDQTCAITDSVSQSGRDDTLPGNTRETYKIRAGMDSQIMETYGQDDGTREGYSVDAKGFGVHETCWEAEYLYGEY